MTQVINLTIGDVGKALEARVGEDRVGTLTDLRARETGERAVQGIDFSQQHDILGTVPALECMGRFASPVTHMTARAVLHNEAGHLGWGEAADLDQVTPGLDTFRRVN